GAHADQFAEVSETCSTEYCGQSALEWSKLIGERYVDFYAQAREFRACIFRLSTVYARPSEDNEPGFVTHYVESVKRGWPIRLPLRGEPIRDILHVEDFSKACRAFIDSPLPRGLYNLGGGAPNAASLAAMIETIGRLIELQPVIDPAPLPAPTPVNYVSDLTRVTSDLNWQPEIGIEEGLRSLL
ncbi:MAG TPA: NAD-dependent epimerase/dehydratase family protein, partial [Pyrinomonadaceae bacterium]